MWKPTLPPFQEHKRKVFKQNIAIIPFIYQIGQTPALREQSKDVPLDQIYSKDIQAKIAYLKKCLLRYRKLTGMGRGVAGVQVGIEEKIVAVYMPEIPGEIMIMINPVITKESQEKLKYPEMCMSAQPAIAPVVRPAWIECTYYDEHGKKQTWNTKADDKLGMMYNRVFEHEIDHLSGIINIDRVQSKDIIYESDPDFYKTASFESVS